MALPLVPGHSADAKIDSEAREGPDRQSSVRPALFGDAPSAKLGSRMLTVLKSGAAFLNALIARQEQLMDIAAVDCVLSDLNKIFQAIASHGAEGVLKLTTAERPLQRWNGRVFRGRALSAARGR
jgi:hypothetical protein